MQLHGSAYIVICLHDEFWSGCSLFPNLAHTAKDRHCGLPGGLGGMQVGKLACTLQAVLVTAILPIV